MCGPLLAVVPALSMVAAGGSAVVGYMGKQANYEATQTAYWQNVQNSEAAARDEQKQLLIRTLQEGDATVQKKQVSYIEGAQKSAIAEASAAAGGVSGASVGNIVNDLEGKAALNRTYADENYKMKAQQLTAEMTGTVDKAQSRINAQPTGTAPNPLELAFGLAGAAAGGVTKGAFSGGGVDLSSLSFNPIRGASGSVA